MRISVLLLFAFLLCGFFVLAQADNAPLKEKVYYYYQGKKLYMPISYQQIVVGVKASSTENVEQKIAITLNLDKAAIQPSSTINQYIIKFSSVESTNAIKEKINRLLQDKDFTFSHPCMLSSAGKFVSYGDEFVIKLKKGTTYNQLQRLSNINQCIITREYVFGNNIYIVAAGQINKYDGLKMANLFFESGLFEYAEPDMTLHNAIDAAPNDPLYNLQWAHNNTGSAAQYSGTVGADMSVQAAWDITMGRNTIKIAVIDEGVELTHPDLQANILQGFDCITLTSNATDGGPKSTARAHGTNCAGIIAAVANNNIGVAGVAPNCKIIPINLASSTGAFTTYSNIAAGFDYARLNGADVISNSWGGGSYSSVLQDAMNRAGTLGRGGKGCVILFASGNNNAGLSSPANSTNVIAVGGVNMCNQRKSPTSCDGENWWGASYGEGLDVVAPCVKIASTDISGTGGYNTASGTAGDYHNTFNGTSSACPNAAGVVALILSVDSNYTYSQVKQILEGSCTKIPGYTFGMVGNQPSGTWNSEVGHGRVNALAAVQLAQTGLFCNVEIVAAGPTKFCSGGSVLLSVANPNITTTYQWKKDGSNISTGSSITATLSGNYTVEATNTNTCIANSAAITVVQLGNSPALTANAGSDKFICTGSSVALGATLAATGGSPVLNDKRVFGMDWFTNSFVKFSLTNPNIFDTIALNMVSASDNTNGYFFTGGCFTPYGYYAITRITNKLIKIDTATGVQTLIGIASISSTYPWSGLSWDATTKTLYGIGSSNSSGSRLCTINPLNGSVLSTTTVSLNQLMWIAINPNGEMYTLSASTDRVYQINKTTGATTALPNTIGVNAENYAQDGSVDPLTGELYMMSLLYSQNYTADLRTINTTTGVSTLIGTMGAYSQIDAAAISGNQYTYSWSPTTGLNDATSPSPIATPTTTTSYILTVIDACGNIAKDTVVVNVNVAGTWLGVNSTWNDNANWCGGTPATTADVIIPAGLVNYPVFTASSVFQCKDIRIDSGASITLNTSAYLTVTGTLTNNGIVSGVGAVRFDGTINQLIQGTGTISNIQITNVNGATIAAGNHKLNITGFLYVTPGFTLTTNDNLVLKSSAAGTARVATNNFPPYIIGKVTIERYIPAKRAYRFMAQPFNAAMPLTQITDDIDITGNNGDVVGGFTPSSGGPSSFWYNPLTGNGSTNVDPGWTAYTTAAQTVGVGDGYRLFVRGIKGNLSPATPAPVTLSSLGTLNTGDFTKNLILGSQSGFNMVGNPFASPVNLNTISKTANVNNNYWVWNPYLGASGGYLTYTFGINDFSLPSSTSFFVQTTAAAQSVTFKENDKVATDTATVLRNSTKPNIIEIALNSNYVLWDKFTLLFNKNANSTKDILLDADKIKNAGANLYSLSTDAKPLAVDVRPYNDATIPLGFTSNAVRSYTFTINTCNLEFGKEIYLRDKYLNTYSKLYQGMEYDFTTDANAASQGEQRFELVSKLIQPIVINDNVLQLSLSPNPTKGNVHIAFNNKTITSTTIAIVTMDGKIIKTINAGKIKKGQLDVDVSKLSKGTYNIVLYNNEGKTIKPLQVQ